MDNKYERLLNVGVLLAMLVIFALTAANYMGKYKACQESSVTMLLEQTSTLEFIVRNHDTLKFPTCFKELNYMGTPDPTVLYVANKTLMGWRPGETVPYCWNENKGYFNCEELC